MEFTFLRAHGHPFAMPQVAGIPPAWTACCSGIPPRACCERRFTTFSCTRRDLGSSLSNSVPPLSSPLWEEKHEPAPDLQQGLSQLHCSTEQSFCPPCDAALLAPYPFAKSGAVAEAQKSGLSSCCSSKERKHLSCEKVFPEPGSRHVQLQAAEDAAAAGRPAARPSTSPRCLARTVPRRAVSPAPPPSTLSQPSLPMGSFGHSHHEDIRQARQRACKEPWTTSPKLSWFAL